MTKLTVIHLSDIHVHGENDACLEWSEKIAGACFYSIRQTDACLIAITGDIAFSGAENQYNIFKEKLLNPLIKILEKEGNKPVYVSLVPGNHDCTLLPKNDVRETLIEAIVENPSKSENEEMIVACTSVQKHFFDLLDSVSNPEFKKYSKLFWQQEFKIGNKDILISSLNAAWMSRLPEQQGMLVYPINKFESQLSKSACIHLALIHHPFNWYAQDAYQRLRQRLRRSCTAILSGHEHMGNAGQVDETISGSSIFFEAAALQAHGTNSGGGFSIYQFDLDKKIVTSLNFEVSTVGVNHKESEDSSYSWTDDSLIHGALDITPEFLQILSDPGGNFTHSAKEKILMEDIFVWPDIRDLNNEETTKQKTKSSQSLFERIKSGKGFVLYGDEKSGKTTLLLRYFRDLVAQGYAPVYLSLSETKLSKVEDIEKRIFSAIDRQYKNPQSIKNISKEKLILLLDDIDRIKSGASWISKIINYAERNFLVVCMTAASGFEVTNLASNEATAALSEFDGFDLTKFGLKLRHQLIKQWCSLSSVTTKQDLDRRIDDVESIVNAVIGKQLVPEYPIYLLILLQSSDQHKHGEIQNSGLSFYYQYLITKSLGEVGVKPQELDEHFNYLSNLAWKFNENSAKEMDFSNLILFNKDFSNRYTTVDLSERLSLLTRARLISKRGDEYLFSYPYVYYFFIGRFLAKNLENPSIKTWVEDSCKKLYLRDRAHAIMFLTHHVENKWVISTICQSLRECFSEKKPIELNGDTSFLNELVEMSAQLTLIAPNIEKNQSEIREIQDNLVEREERDDIDMLGIASKWNLLHKTAEILGLILKNYYGSLERPQKQEMIKEVFDGPLRALRLLLEEIAEDLPSFVNELKLFEISKNKNLTPEEAEKKVKRRVFNTLGWVSTGVVASIGNYISSDRLREDITMVVSESPTNSYRLIEAASRLLRPGSIPLDRIRKLATDLESNHYAFGILQSLAVVHLYMYHIDAPQKQALCSALKISIEQSKSIDIKKHNRMLK